MDDPIPQGARVKSSSEVKIFGAILVVAVILVTLFVVPMLLVQGPPTPVAVNLDRKLLVPPGSHVRGDPNAPTTIVVFSDFQCPSCSEGSPVVKEIIEKNPGRVKEVFHHFQAKPEHIYARLFARATEAAAEQGKFWEMHDGIFEQQEKLAQGTVEEVKRKIRELAEKRGLDLAKYDAAMAKENDEPFRRDNKLGLQVQLEATPSYFIIGPDGNVKKYGTTEAIQNWGVVFTHEQSINAGSTGAGAGPPKGAAAEKPRAGAGAP
jgi:protein-disulfide isomerase